MAHNEPCANRVVCNLNICLGVTNENQSRLLFVQMKVSVQKIVDYFQVITSLLKKLSTGYFLLFSAYPQEVKG